ncbi:MAG TPA: hypothetical protein VK338_01470 [Candidatus Nitrosocosmicus sp.]|nr:hypothetical protein [Candidatus Nitrosocosmicus sp.]
MINKSKKEVNMAEDAKNEVNSGESGLEGVPFPDRNDESEAVARMFAGPDGTGIPLIGKDELLKNATHKIEVARVEKQRQELKEFSMGVLGTPNALELAERFQAFGNSLLELRKNESDKLRRHQLSVESMLYISTGVLLERIYNEAPKRLPELEESPTRQELLARPGDDYSSQMVEED